MLVDVDTTPFTPQELWVAIRKMPMDFAICCIHLKVLIQASEEDEHTYHVFFVIIQIVQYVVNSMSNRFVAYHHLSSFHLLSNVCFLASVSPHWREKCQAAKFPTSQQRLQPRLKRWEHAEKWLRHGNRWQRGRGFGEKFRRFLACLTWFANGANQTVMKFHTQSCDAV